MPVGGIIRWTQEICGALPQSFCYRVMARGIIEMADNAATPQEEYEALHRMYASRQLGDLSPLQFYASAVFDGVSTFTAFAMLRDLYSLNLQECTAIRDQHNGYSRVELSTIQDGQWPTRGEFCPKCEKHIPRFSELDPVTESQLRAMDDSFERIKRRRELTGCSLGWSKLWCLHPDGPHPVFGDPNASPCPKCGKRLRTSLAKQCVECGADWH